MNVFYVNNSTGTTLNNSQAMQEGATSTATVNLSTDEPKPEPASKATLPTRIWNRIVELGGVAAGATGLVLVGLTWWLIKLTEALIKHGD